MKLIKCIKCGRPFYDNEPKCPYCGSDTSLSAENYITKPISDPESHKTMEDVLSGNYQPKPQQPEPLAPAPMADMAEPVPPMETIPPMETPITEPVVEMAESTRAEAMAAIESQSVEAVNEMVGDVNEAINEVETSYAPRKRHRWIWIVILILLLAAAAAVYWKWDFVYAKVMSLLGK